ncbi:MAG: phosphoribosylformylglycinamidine synthase subunit PurQ, partial [Alphaproteobacteria bacterium]|nr:phosphoribosylformylglycinamidine synthase subunit PurQ [Alphaproteobacteria bacterium]
VLGLMPHPERAADPVHGGSDGRGLLDSLVSALS